eukprot:CAMPEP_0173414022 /NCGR_PEP_ID=MMETSP1356-20130122/83432_1 /TAXON_ID=77927 ORGANISM="Hemiselmis virescens, Strain PCC157" /NCGR_SAMPLE_ID=MMETSP1356 /ASSEMBLY_ACC=CAM_ASM_000847 /LENGTH=55 /DNA_ID=CAMNT_0014376137 /DNA_START=164 /DNA_END=327 /DNA_ORIENTATION=-
MRFTVLTLTVAVCLLPAVSAWSLQPATAPTLSKAPFDSRLCTTHLCPPLGPSLLG